MNKSLICGVLFLLCVQLEGASTPIFIMKRPTPSQGCVPTLPSSQRPVQPYYPPQQPTQPYYPLYQPMNPYSMPEIEYHEGDQESQESKSEYG